jgi:hypothetical protein
MKRHSLNERHKKTKEESHEDEILPSRVRMPSERPARLGRAEKIALAYLNLSG